MDFQRQLQLQSLTSSAFLFGPRMTGKTFLLHQLKVDLFIDLLDPEIELEFRSSPRRFWEQLSVLKNKSLVIVDEIQKIPSCWIMSKKASRINSFVLSFPGRARVNSGAEEPTCSAAGRWIFDCIR